MRPSPIIFLALTLTLALGPATGRTQQATPPNRGSREASNGATPALHPLVLALDTDRNGELSPEEIANASESLQKLDRNKDGKLDRNEIQPSGRSRAGAGRGNSAQINRTNPPNLSNRIMNFDRDRDGKVTKEELPPRMHSLLENADADGDGAIDKTEADQMAREFQQRIQRRQQGNRNSPPQ